VLQARVIGMDYPSPLRGGAASESEPGWGFSKNHNQRDLFGNFGPPPDRRFATATLPTLRGGGIKATSRLFLALAQEVFGQIGERGPWQRRKRQRPGDIDRSQSQPRGQKAVEKPFAEPL
jgi:hypothetical protein